MAWCRWWRRDAPLLSVTGDTGTGPVVVMIHGIASSSVTFHHLVPLLEATHRCITIDILGFGTSPAPESATYSLDEHAAAVDRTIRSLGLREPFTLVGHSLGGLIAARYAATHRRELNRLVLVSSPIYLSPSMLGDSADRAMTGAYFTIYEYLRLNPRFTQRTAAALAAIAPIKNVLELTEQNWTPFMLSLHNAIESQTTLADLLRVRVPIDLVCGALDPFLAPSGLAMVQQLRHVRPHRVSGVAHIIRPKLAQAVARVIEQPPAPGGHPTVNKLEACRLRFSAAPVRPSPPSASEPGSSVPTGATSLRRMLTRCSTLPSSRASRCSTLLTPTVTAAASHSLPAL